MVQELYPAVTTCVTDVKIILTGSVCVGKTSLFQRFTNGAFEEHKAYVATVSGAFSSKQVTSAEWRLTLNIWDTAGSERFKSMSTMFFRGAKAAIVCFDLSVQGSFEDAKIWMTEVKATEPECKIYLCGTKKDLIDNGVPRAEPQSKILRYADGIQCTFMETSSKTGENVDQLFQKVADDYVAVPGNIKKLGDVVRLQRDTKKRSCCGFT